MNEIQVGRYNAVLHKLLSMKEGAPSPLLAPEIFPMLMLEGERPEWLWLGGIGLGIRRELRAADVGNFSYLALQNPVASGAILAVESLMSNIAKASYRIQFAPAPLGNESKGAQMDTRAGLFPNVVTAVGEGANNVAVALPGTRLATVTLLEAVPYPWPFILTPGTALVVGGIVVNQAVEVLFRWRERVFEPSESR